MIRLRAALANTAWVASCFRSWASFRQALHDPVRAQAAVLREIERACSGTPVFPGRFRDLPPRGWDDFAPLVSRAAQGERGVLTRERIARFEPTSGSSTATKLVPSTPLLRTQFHRAIHAWVFDLYSRRPELLAGFAYWSISPTVPSKATSGGIPVGFDEDSAYLGRLGRILVEQALAVPGRIRHIAPERFRHATLLLLLNEPELRLVSVWSPTFLTSLMEYFELHRDELFRDLRNGVVVCGRRVRRAVPRDPWPKLGLISCWTDGRARMQLSAFSRWFPETPVQPKGLIATEGIVSLPFEGERPLAVTSHFLEFELDDGRLLGVEDLKEGDEACVVISTGGGLVRYRLGDRIVVTGRLYRTPCIRFLGRRDLVCDLCGEKLTEAFVTEVLAGLGVKGFALLAPDGDGYTLYAKTPPNQALLEDRLSANVHYQWAVRLGQLRPARTYRIRNDAEATYLRTRLARGCRLGDIKPVSLSINDGWSEVFAGKPAPIREVLSR